MTHPMTSLPGEHAAFAALLDAQPAPVRDAFNYLLCLLMAERGALRLVETHPGAGGEGAFERRRNSPRIMDRPVPSPTMAGLVAGAFATASVSSGFS